MKKFKKISQIVIPLFIIVAVLGSTVVLFCNRFSDNNISPNRPVRFFEGINRGSGIHLNDSETYNFSSKNYFYRDCLTAFQENNFTSYGVNAMSKESDISADSYFKYSESENDGYIEFGQCSGFVEYPTVYFPVSHSDGNVSGDYEVEFDFFASDDFSQINSNKSNWWFMAFCLSIDQNGGKDYSKIFLHKRSDGFWHLSLNEKLETLGSESNLFTFNEWYNFRIEYTLDESSTNYNVTVYVNDVEVLSTFTPYFKTDVIEDKDNYPAFFRFVPRGYAKGMIWGIDNVYACKTK